MSSFVSIADRESGLLAAYAVHSAAGRGRVYPEPQHPFRGPFQRDRDRIVHCGAFRRLGQKTQVFTGNELGDYHRTRLTHTLEATSIARTIGRALRLNEDLIEALTLMHDLGHPPYGHAGEDALNECLRGCGGFNHNSQALRIVEILEQRTPRHPGLNLSRETLEGQRSRCVKTRASESPPLEVQIVEASDSLTYDSHDPDDALHYRLLTLDELNEVPFWRAACERVLRRDADPDEFELRRATVHELIDWQVTDLIEQTAANLKLHGIATSDDLRRAPILARPSAEIQDYKRELERFLYDRVYRTPRLLTERRVLQDKLRGLFRAYCDSPDQLPAPYRERFENHGVERSVGDYLAGMTDRFAEQEFERVYAGERLET